jgi:hypothetical protein
VVHLARSGRCTGPVPVRKDMARGSLNKAEANADRLTQVEAHAAPVQFRWAAGDTRRLRDLPHHRETLPLALASHLSEAPQVMPEEAGPVKGLMCPFFFLFPAVSRHAGCRAGVKVQRPAGRTTLRPVLVPATLDGRGTGMWLRCAPGAASVSGRRRR